MRRQIAVFDHKEPSSVWTSFESEKDQYSHLIREATGKTWAADVPRRYVCRFDLNKRRM
jgi:hypothetical protein